MIRKVIFILVCLVALSSCHWNGGKSSDSAELNIKVARYDRLLFEYVTMNNLSALQKMNTDFPQATKLLIEDVLAIGEVDDNKINDRLMEYYADTTLLVLIQDAEEKFKDMGWIEKKLTKGFKQLKKEVPSLPVPHFYAQLSALNQSVVVGDSIVGFSIDKYMGADYPLYKRFYYDNQCRSMEPDRIVPDCFTFYLLSEYPMPWGPGRTLLDMILHRGKINWVVARILGYESFEKEMGYDEKEAEWCRKNKSALWQGMLDNGHLDATDPLIVRSYIRKDPFIPIMTGERTPASIGVWMGILLIDEYMKTHDDVTINDLLNDTDYRRILSEVDFKP